eukprot:3167118-Amphidinium_carterae.1
MQWGLGHGTVLVQSQQTVGPTCKFMTSHLDIPSTGTSYERLMTSQRICVHLDWWDAIFAGAGH